MKDKIKSLVRQRLADRRIVLFGAGEVAEEFYKKYGAALNISHCVSNLNKEWGEAAFLGKLDVRKYVRSEIQENDYIIVCGPIAFRSIELQLNMEGMRMYDDFVESNIAGAIMENKKIALFYGQCILRDIYKCLIQVPAFTEEYAPVFTQSVKHKTVVLNRLLYYIKDISDLYVYTPRILDVDSIYYLSPKELPADCRIVSLSNLLVPMYWPQIDIKLENVNNWYFHSYNSERDLDFYHSLYRREDCNITKMIRDGMSVSQVVDTLSSEDFYTEKQVVRNRDISFKLVGIAENNIDVTILDFLKEHYHSEMLYQNFVHPNKTIIWEYVRRLLTVLGISTQDIEYLKERSPEHIHQSGDVPIYPSVVKHLKLEFIHEDTQYEILTGNGIVYMNFKEYTAHFAEYTKKVMEIARMW